MHKNTSEEESTASISHQDSHKKDSEAKGSLRDTIIFAVFVFALVIPFRLFVAQPFIVQGASMQPTFDTGDYLIVDQITYDFSQPKRGDVVIIRYPENPSRFFIKRIVGLPSETVRIDGLNVFITTKNGDKIQLVEPQVEKTRASHSKTILTDSQYYVMGDNRAESLDSRYFGPLEEKFVVGRAIVRLFPISKLDYLPGNIQ